MKVKPRTFRFTHAMANGPNPYQLLRKTLELGKECRESSIPVTGGAVSFREWPCGCILVRKAIATLGRMVNGPNEWPLVDLSLDDEVAPCAEHLAAVVALAAEEVSLEVAEVMKRAEEAEAAVKEREKPNE